METYTRLVAEHPGSVVRLDVYGASKKNDYFGKFWLASKEKFEPNLTTEQYHQQARNERAVVQQLLGRSFLEVQKVLFEFNGKW